jgi:hypothetical protein
MSVNDISGLPILEVFSDDRVVMGSYNRNTLVVSGSTVTISGSLNISGSFLATASFAISSSFSTASSRATTASFATTASYALNAATGGSGTGFPFSGSAVITGSLLVSGSGITTSGVLTNAVASRTVWTDGSNITNPAAFPNSTDGNAATRWDTSAFQTAGQIYAVNFNETLTVNTFIMDTTGSPNDYPTLFDISSSLDGTNWTPIGTVSGATVTTYNFTPSITTRQLQFRIITARAGNYWSVHEFNVSQSRGAGALTASGSVIFNGITDTTTTNKVLVLETSTGRLFTTSSVAGGGSGTGFPFSGSAVITGSLVVSGSSTSSIFDVYKSGSTVLSIEGSQGQLFSVTDSLSGSLMSVNDITGLPILEVFSDDRVVMGTFGRNTLVVTGSRVGIDKAIPTADLDISGSVLVTGSFIATNMILPSTASILPQTGSMFYSSSFIYVYDGTRYRSASLV